MLLALSSASHVAHEKGGGWPYGLIYVLSILTAFMTAFYTGRAFFMTFFGAEKLPAATDPEAPPHAEPSGSPGHLGHRLFGGDQQHRGAASHDRLTQVIVEFLFRIGVAGIEFTDAGVHW